MLPGTNTIEALLVSSPLEDEMDLEEAALAGNVVEGVVQKKKVNLFAETKP